MIPGSPELLLVIMRGIPGCGKTTYVGRHFKTGKIISADFYMAQWGRFDPMRLKEAHDRCFVDCLMAMKRKLPLIVLDNTNIKEHEFTRFFRLAIENNYTVRVIRLECPPEIGAARNVHGVPLETIKRMAETLGKSNVGDEIVPFSEGSDNGIREGR